MPKIINEKLIVIKKNPLILLTHDFVNLTSCNKIINNYAEYLEKALVIDKNGQRESKGRTNKTAIINETSSVIENLKNKIFKSFSIQKSSLTRMQLLRYQAGEKYNPHFDAFGKDLLEKSKINQRLTTFILYLSDDYEGGETHFPLREVEIKPRIGSLLIFNNCFHGTNFTHPKSLHGSKSIKVGTKWAINFWSCEEVSIDKIL